LSLSRYEGNAAQVRTTENGWPDFVASATGHHQSHKWVKLGKLLPPGAKTTSSRFHFRDGHAGVRIDKRLFAS
jgi:hypothetical protein